MKGVYLGCLFYGILGMSNFAVATMVPDASLVMDRILLNTCQSTGTILYNLCVAPEGSVDTKFCSATLGIYKTCLYELNHKLSLDVARDPYHGKIFSPCGLQIANLILSDICTRPLR